MVLILSPRLDRPSAVGEEGRPRSASLALATLVVVLYAGAVTVLLGLARSVELVLLGAGVTVAALALIEREDAAATFVGHFCFLPGCLFLFGGTLVGVLHGLATGVVVIGIGLALFGTGAAWADALGRGQLATALQGGGLAVVGIVFLLVVGLVTVGTSWLLWMVVEPMVSPGTTDLGGLLFVVGVTALAVSIALPRLPFVALAPRDRRSEIVELRSRATRLAFRLGLGGLAAWVVVDPLESLGVIPPVGSILGLLVGVHLRVGLALAGAFVLALVLVVGVVRRVAGADATTARRLAPVAAVFGLLTIPVPLLVVLLVVVQSGIPFGPLAVAVAFSLVTFAAVVVLLVLAAIPAAATVGLLPHRAAPIALAATGLLVAAIGAGTAGLSPLVAVGGVAAAVFAWDVSEFGLGLTAEVGHLPESRRVELLHGVAGAGVAVASVAITGGAYVLVRGVAPDAVGLPSAMALAVLGTLVLAVTLRG